MSTAAQTVKRWKVRPINLRPQPYELEPLVAIEVVSAEDYTALERRVPMWQPIETAPKDIRVLVGGGDCPYVHENMLRCFGASGCAWGGLGNKQQPTHWMPLPAPPDAGGTKAIRMAKTSNQVTRYGGKAAIATTPRA